MDKDFREQFKKDVLTEWGDCFGINHFYDTINQYDEDNTKDISNIVITFNAQSLRDSKENDFMLLVDPDTLYSLIQTVLTEHTDDFLAYLLQQASNNELDDDGLPF